MKFWFIVSAGFLSMNCAHAAKACADLKSEISSKLDSAGVKSYTLEIVDKTASGDGKVVGSCEGGTKKILYSKK